MSEGGRRDPRYRVHLQVRFLHAKAFVKEYAENLSRRGLFVAGPTHLEPLQQVDLAIDLPGDSVFRVTAEVAHVLDEPSARTLGREPGVGLAITEAPAAFDDALSAYLVRLGRRADVMVITDDEPCGLLLAAAGFQVRTVADAHQAVTEVARAPVRVLAVLITRARAEGFRAAVAGAGGADLVVAIDGPDDFDDLLRRLDDDI